MLTFYFSGHNFEYEARNALRIFDLNINYEIKNIVQLKENKELGIVSTLEEKEGVLISTSLLYWDNDLLYSSKYRSDEILLEKDNEKKLKKILIVKAMHQVLKSYYKVIPDYGILTGVRVVKIMLTARKYGNSDEKIKKILKETYEVTDEKIKLLFDIIEIEEKYIDDEVNMNNYNLYIGIPFCPTKCSYCSFTSYVNCNDDKINAYLDTLVYEIEKTIEFALNKNLNLNTVYIGGGTPSVLNEEQINRIFKSIKKFYDLYKIREITFEAGRPDTLSKEKLICLKNNFVNRISINPQTMNGKTLKAMKRNHTVEDIVEKYQIAREIGFESINMDIILGFPGETEEDVKHTIEEVIKLRPENITVHCLAYKKNSELTRESSELLKDYELIRKMHDVIKEKSKNHGYKPYYMYRQKNIKGNSENVGYTLLSKESIYNMIIIEEMETILACGIGASSKIMTEYNKHVPVRNFKSLEEYSARIDEIINKKKKLLQ
ncbi:MAG: coproporphyrinogen dehydrogenase HemZ [Sedimentibacter sp.]|uniref:coproporphyrinogen dehydrogenase HemZ n=1 Tax=Sedimentibacter sp. TaxID=1960295 RepID=UPI002981B592|nr:coproporphyrinogen dehydrogenase HemZ [Sedimentibacter sp.]MDW5299916.1 coproporphyrinogen dehydrogenase HemZ [Sedimentibacter sp.]